MTDHRQFVPHSILDRAFWEGVRDTAALAPLFEGIERQAAQADLHPAPPLATDFLAAKRSNNRGILDRWWREGRSTLAALAVRRLVRGIEAGDDDDRLLNHLWVQATQPTWVVSAHLPGFDLPETNRVTIDLAAAELAAELAEMCETLRPWMESLSGTLYSRVLHEIDARVLGPFADGPPLHWESGGSNWAGVCAGSILTACLSFEAMGRPRPQAKARALAVLDRYLQSGFTEHGECDEGIGYWGYGLSLAVGGWMRLTPTKYAASVNHERLRQIGDYPRRAHLFGDTFFAGNDADMCVNCPAWLAEALARSEGLNWLTAWANLSGPPRSLGAFTSALRVLASPTASGDAALTPPPGAFYLPDQQTAVLRGDTPGGELIGILSGGHNGELHNHNDVGQFLMIFNEDTIIPDLGNRHYTADFFGPKRYNYLAASSRGHNCPMVGGFEQKAGKEAGATVREWDAAAGHLALEASAAYPPAVGLTEWVRALRRVDGGQAGAAMVISDDFTTRHSGRTIVSRVWSTRPIETLGLGQFRLGPLTLAVTPPPPDYMVTTVDGSEEGLRSFDGQTLHCLDLTYQTDEQNHLATSLKFTPASGA